jgi:hypothetical protein
MKDFYRRLEQIQGVTCVLSGDALRLEKAFGPRRPVEIDSEVAGVRRQYVRAVFALIEAVVEQHRLLLLGLSEARVVSLDDGVAQKLRKVGRAFPLPEKITEVYEAAEHAFGQPIEVAYEPLMAAKEVRNRLTHPRSFEGCAVYVLELDKMKAAGNWFRDLNNRFVKAAKQHREAHDNWRVAE